MTAILNASLDTILANWTKKVAAEKPATPKDPRLVAAVAKASEHFGFGSGHYKAIVHVICALKEADPTQYIGEAIGYKVGDVLVMESHGRERNQVFAGDTCVVVSSPDGDTDAVLFGISKGTFNLMGGESSTRMRDGKFRTATLAEATAFVKAVKKAKDPAAGTVEFDRSKRLVSAAVTL